MVRVISNEVAQQVHEMLQNAGGLPSVNRVVIVALRDDSKTASGIIIPKEALDDFSKRAVIVQVGPLEDCVPAIEKNLRIGNIVFYGDYAGKELHHVSPELQEFLGDSLKLSVLTLTEVIYIKSQQ